MLVSGGFGLRGLVH